MAVMGSGDVVVGKPTSKPDQPTLKDPAHNADPSRPSRPRQQQMCGAMSQQGDEYHTLSQPQEFVRLIGHREAKVRPPRAPG
jgi:hypothetical protein